MVKFYLISNENGVAEYEYYPEGNTDKKPGIISFDTANGNFTLKTVSEIETPHAFHIYASHTRSRIRELFEKGTLPDKGLVMWY